jgi:tetratricopeptide (TPR) repeat protein
MVRNQFDDARSLFERALTVAEAYRHEEFKARIHASLASLLVQTLQPKAAATEIAAARPYYESVRHTRNLALLDAMSGQVRLGLMEYDAAVEQFRGAITHAIEIADKEQELTGRENLATALAGAGLYVEALEEYRRVRQLHESAGRARGVVFATLNIIDVLTRLGRFEEARKETVPPIEEAAREQRAQVKRIESAVAFREGRFAAARQAAAQSLELGKNLSPERLARAEFALCLSTAHMNSDSHHACDAAERRIGAVSHPAIQLEGNLALAEARLAVRDTAGARPFLAAAGTLLPTGASNEHRWRWLALSLAAAVDSERLPLRERVTHELDQLRLKWGEGNLMSWRRRADVTAVLEPLHL